MKIASCFSDNGISQTSKRPNPPLSLSKISLKNSYDLMSLSLFWLSNSFSTCWSFLIAILGDNIDQNIGYYLKIFSLSNVG